MSSTSAQSVAPQNPDFRLKEGHELLSPKDMLELARVRTGTANDKGDLVLVPVSKHSFEEEKTDRRIYIKSLNTTSIASPQSLEGGTAFWLDSRTVGHVKVEENDGRSESCLYAVAIEVQADSELSLQRPVLVGSFPTDSAANFRYSKKARILIFSDYVHADGDLTKVHENDEAWDKRGNSALVYDDGFERQWDNWTGPKRSSLFAVKLDADAAGREWRLDGEFRNLLAGTGNHCPVEPFGGIEDFDVSDHQVVYTTKDSEVPEPSHTRQNIYTVDFLTGVTRNLTSGFQGATSCPVFSHSGGKVAWLEMDKDGYYADSANIVIYDLTKDVRFILTRSWDRSPSAVVFSEDDTVLYLLVPDEARTKIFALPLSPTPTTSTTHPNFLERYNVPVPLTHSGTASGLQVLPGGRLLFTLMSLTSPNDVHLLNGLQAFETKLTNSFDDDTVAEASSIVTVAKVTHFNEQFLSSKAIISPEYFTFEGAEGKMVQGWLIKPSVWMEGEKKKWPAIMMIHGGPQDVFGDVWSTRWCPVVLAHQGYFVVIINFTGSTSFGQEFTDAINKDWGGKPFVDLKKGWDHILGRYSEIDTDRTVAMGGSWGGYAINWIQGHPEYGFNFKAVTCHDGVFDTHYDAYTTDEDFFYKHEYGGHPWEEGANEIAEKFNPRNFVQKWHIPQLNIHGVHDFRLPLTDGIGAFHALKQRGIPARLVVFPDENHWVLKPGNSLKWHFEIFRWFDTFLERED